MKIVKYNELLDILLFLPSLTLLREFLLTTFPQSKQNNLPDRALSALIL